MNAAWNRGDAGDRGRRIRSSSTRSCGIMRRLPHRVRRGGERPGARFAPAAGVPKRDTGWVAIRLETWRVVLQPIPGDRSTPSGAEDPRGSTPQGFLVAGGAAKIRLALLARCPHHANRSGDHGSKYREQASSRGVRTPSWSQERRPVCGAAPPSLSRCLASDGHLRPRLRRRADGAGQGRRERDSLRRPSCPCGFLLSATATRASAVAAGLASSEAAPRRSPLAGRPSRPRCWPRSCRRAAHVRRAPARGRSRR